MITTALAFISSFIFIGLKSIQQLNVVHKCYRWIVPTSMMMAFCEIYVIATVATQGWGWMVIPIGLGGGLGSLCSTWLHDRLMNKEK